MSAIDIAISLILLFAVAIGAVIGYTILTELENNPALQAEGFNTTFLDTGQSALLIFDTAGVFILVGLFIGIMITSFLARTHPVFLVIAIVLLAVQILFAALLSNTYFNVVTEDATLSLAADNFTTTTFIFQNLPIITAVLGILALIVLYGKTPSNPSGDI